MLLFFFFLIRSFPRFFPLLHLMGKILPLRSPLLSFSPLCPSVLWLCVLSPSLPLFPLARCGMQTCRNLGLKMIDQTCQFWLPLLKMAAAAVCTPAIGERLSYTPLDWCFRLRPCRFFQLFSFFFFFFVGQKCEHQVLFAPAVEGASLFCCSSPPSWMDASLLAAVEVFNQLHQFIRFDYCSYDIKTDTIERNTTLKACCLHQYAREPKHVCVSSLHLGAYGR